MGLRKNRGSQGWNGGRKPGSEEQVGAGHRWHRLNTKGTRRINLHRRMIPTSSAKNRQRQLKMAALCREKWVTPSRRSMDIHRNRLACAARANDQELPKSALGASIPSTKTSRAVTRMSLVSTANLASGCPIISLCPSRRLWDRRLSTVSRLDLHLWDRSLTDRRLSDRSLWDRRLLNISPSDRRLWERSRLYRRPSNRRLSEIHISDRCLRQMRVKTMRRTL